MKKTILKNAIAIALGTSAFTAQAALTPSAVLEFDTGTVGVVGCLVGTAPPCNNPAFNVTDVVGSYFSMDGNGSGTLEKSEKVAISMNNGIHIGTAQGASGSHGGQPGCVNGDNGCTAPFGAGENPDIDNPWNFFGNTGMHQTTSPITVLNDFGSVKELDFSGWGVAWNGIPNIPMGGDTANFPSDTGIATITCSQSSCSNSSTYVLDYNARVPLGDPSGFGGVPYTLHLEGHVNAPTVPVPAAAWLFGSGLLGLVGVARRKARA